MSTESERQIEVGSHIRTVREIKRRGKHIPAGATGTITQGWTNMFGYKLWNVRFDHNKEDLTVRHHFLQLI